jgi:hypothetical protein
VNPADFYRGWQRSGRGASVLRNAPPEAIRAERIGASRARASLRTSQAMAEVLAELEASAPVAGERTLRLTCTRVALNDTRKPGR